MDVSPIGDTGTGIAWARIVENAAIATMVLHGESATDHWGSIIFANASARSLFRLPASCGERDRIEPFVSILELFTPNDHSTVTSLLESSGGTAQVFDTRGHERSLHVSHESSGWIIAQVVEKADSRIDEVLDEQQRFRSALLELSELAHTSEDDDDFYQRLIERAVEVVPGAQGGSVQLNITGSASFRFVAAVGYDLAGLQQHVLEQRHFFRDAWDPTAQIIRNFENSGRTPEIRDWLRTVGRLEEIVVNVSAPVLSGGFPVAFLSLDNFEDPDAMNETSVEMTTVLSRLIGDLWRRRELEAAVRKEREAFRHLALHDPLTSLANRRNLERSLTAAMKASARRNSPSAVLFVDLDDFKGVNDRLGHEVGDRLLIGVANELADVVRAGDVVGRWGGDEFLILPHRVNSPAEVMALAQRILDRFEIEIDLGDELLYRARLSVGVGWSAESQSDVDTLVRVADEALYEAKAAGKGTVRFHEATS